MSSICSLSGDDHLRMILVSDEPLVVSPPYPPAALTTPDTDQDDQDDNAPECIKPVGVDGWPLPDTDKGAGDEVPNQKGSEDRSGSTSHASANQALGGSDA
jgi:hypothetical protein